MVIDTSSKLCSVGIKHNDERIYKTLDEGRTHSETLLPLINEILKENNISLDEIEALGVVIGPGSFTGIRIGISTIKAISFAKDIPVVEISSTEVLARNIGSESTYKIGIIDAKNDQIYAGVFTNTYELNKEFAGSILEFLDILKDIKLSTQNRESLVYTFSGSGTKYQDLIKKNLQNENIHIVFNEDINQNIEKVLEAVEDKIKDQNNLVDGRKIVPNYLKSSNAERK